MALTTKSSRVKDEYKMYHDISDKIKLYNGEVVNVQDLGNEGLDAKTIEVLEKINERKSILKDISEVDVDRLSKEKQKELEERLKKSDEYFINISEIDRKKIEEIFEKQGENLARTQEWQSYHMIFSGMDQLSLITKSEAYHDKLNELESKSKKFVEVKKKTAHAVKEKGGEIHRVKESYKAKDRAIEKEKKELARQREKEKKLSAAYSFGMTKHGKYNADYEKLNQKIDNVKKIGTYLVGPLEKQADELNTKREVLEGKMALIEKESNKTLKRIKEHSQTLEKLEKDRQNNELDSSLKEYEDTYRETFGETNTEIPQTTDRDEWIKSCQNTAIKLLEKQKLHLGKHKNSTEFTNMMKALEAIRDHSEEKFVYGKDRPFEFLIRDLKETAQTYRKEKNKQHRLFPSTMRVTRLKLADLLESWSERMQSGMVKGKPDKTREKKIEAFYETKGKPEKTKVNLGPNKLNRDVIPKVHQMLDKMNESFKDTLLMEETMDEICANFKTVCNLEKIAYSLGYPSTDDVKNMRLSDVMDTLSQVYEYQPPKENVNNKTVDQELKEMDFDIEGLEKM